MLLSVGSMTSTEDSPYTMQEYVVRFGDESSSSAGFQIVSAASLSGAEVSVWGIPRDGATLISISDPVLPSDASGQEPSTKRLRGVLEPKNFRSEKNVPDGVPLSTWISGVSTEPLPGFSTKLRFMVAPQPSWEMKEIFVHSSTTAGDAKHFLQQYSIPSSTAELYGTISKAKLPWHKRLLEGSNNNWAPMEDRVMVPSSFRLEFHVPSFVAFHGVLPIWCQT